VLAACDGGASEVASPGEGTFGGGTGGGGGGGGGGNPGPAPGQPAADCPAGFANVGTVANGTLRACQLPSQITGNLVVPLRAGTVYAISGRVDVGSDRGNDPNVPRAGSQQGILTIDPGVRLYGSAGLDYIVVNRGSQIFAEGTATSPIIFTSRQSIEGQTNENSIGQWGGLVILGRAPTAACPSGVTPPNASCEAQVEGTNAFYGGNTANDNSGRLRYVRVQHSGFQILENNELNGITLAGVGSGTTIENVQVHNSSDDGIELFGGTVNLRFIVLTGNDDDSLDTDTGWRGGAQFVIARQRAGGGDRVFEMSSAGNAALNSQPKVANFTLIGSTRTGAGDIITLNSGTGGRFINGVATSPNPSTACLDIDGSATVAAAPRFDSVNLACTIPFRDDTDVNAAATASVFNAGANNSSNHSSTLNGFINGPNETARPATNPSTIYAFFSNTTYVGAVRDASDTWYQGWTCGLTAGSTC
jgi:hypothetical protein